MTKNTQLEQSNIESNNTNGKTIDQAKKIRFLNIYNANYIINFYIFVY